MNAVRYVVLCLYFVIATKLSGQQAQHVNLIYQWNPDTIPGIFNDLWGYEAPDGKEYAIVGTSQYVYFFDISDTSNIYLADQHRPGYSSTWRDFKTYDHYAYGVTDQSSSHEGLLIYDLQYLPDSVRFVKAVTSDFRIAHNIFIDTLNARLYACGTNTHSQGMVVYDLTDPENPLLIGTPRLDQDPNGPAPGDGYVHDLYVRDDTAYTSHGYDGFWIWDFNDAANPIAIGGIDQGPGYNHSNWLTADGRYAIFAEEIPSGQPLAVTDLINLEEPDIVHTFKEPLLAPTHTDNVPHNPYIKDNYLYVSYYEDGVQIWDITDPLNPVKHGYYDTAPENTNYNGTDKNWGVYPFLKQDKIIATDTDNGFFVLHFNNQSPLPLSLVSFQAKTYQKDKVIIEWKTTQEVNVDRFILERADNEAAFKPITQIKAKNQSQYNRYQFIDQKPVLGKNFYRLRSIDHDGTEQVYNIVSIRSTPSEPRLFPNPTTGRINISIPQNRRGTYTVEIRELTGKLMYKSKVNNSLSIELKTILQPGMYIAVLANNNIPILTKNLILLR